MYNLPNNLNKLISKDLIFRKLNFHIKQKEKISNIVNDIILTNQIDINNEININFINVCVTNFGKKFYYNTDYYMFSNNFLFNIYKQLNQNLFLSVVSIEENVYKPRIVIYKKNNKLVYKHIPVDFELYIDKENNDFNYMYQNIVKQIENIELKDETFIDEIEYKKNLYFRKILFNKGLINNYSLGRNFYFRTNNYIMLYNKNNDGIIGKNENNNFELENEKSSYFSEVFFALENGVYEG